jgi:hypothetical protein
MAFERFLSQALVILMLAFAFVVVARADSCGSLIGDIDCSSGRAGWHDIVTPSYQTDSSSRNLGPDMSIGGDFSSSSGDRPAPLFGITFSGGQRCGGTLISARCR